MEEFSGDKIKEFENEEELGEEDNCTAMAGNFLDGKKEKVEDYTFFVNSKKTGWKTEFVISCWLIKSITCLFENCSGVSY